MGTIFILSLSLSLSQDDIVGYKGRYMWNKRERVKNMYIIYGIILQWGELQ
jgi:hypothetical protein